ncbi:MAG TPA: aminotransferase class I/II-fold pyridoxal phosphate-dependent enzyme [Thermoanaerobaculia bacterium]|nr:aminotransferase class I/II-fold pyridoxal phosphate-dependent enzyme [Thermoanaerobaculia bacterium]
MISTGIKPAARNALLGFSDIVKIRNRVLDMKAAGQHVYELQGGEPFMPTPSFVKRAMIDALDHNHTRYAPSSGIAPLLGALREKLARKNAIEVDAKKIIVCSGGQHALFCAFQASVNPGDGVMLFSPFWTPIRDHINYSGGVAQRIPWDDARGVDDLTPVLHAHHTDATRVIYVNTPSNPTGDVLSRKAIESIARFAARHNLIVISDEAYEDLVYDGEHVSIASLPEMFLRTISCFTLSKSFAMTGWRIGYVVADEPFMEFLRKMVLFSVNGISTPTQYAAVGAMNAPPDYFAPIREEYRKRRDMLARALNEAGFRCLTPPGAFYLFPDVRERLGNDSWKAMETLLARTQIASVPGAVFGPEGEGHLRVSFSTSLDVLEQAVDALKKL